MAIKSDYISGTLTITQGSTTFTGTGTGWRSAAFNEGDTLIDITGATEYMGVIDSITGEASGTLTKPWEGPSLVNVPYRMRYQPDGARSTAQARNLIEILGNGKLESLASLSLNENQIIKGGPLNSLVAQDFEPWAQSMLALDGAAKKIARTTSNNEAALIDFTDAMAELAADPDFETMRATMGAASQDDIINRLGDPYPSLKPDCNHADFANGWYWVNESSTNKPPGGSLYWRVERRGISEDWIHETASDPFITSRTAELVYERWRHSGTTWTEWILAKPYKTHNILGIAAFSGGVNTGAIIEAYSDGVAHYSRFADGTQICSYTPAFDIPISAAPGAVGITGDVFGFTAAFATQPVVTHAGYVTDAGGSRLSLPIQNEPTSTPLTVWGFSVNNTSPVAVTRVFRYRMLAVGRWRT